MSDKRPEQQKDDYFRLKAAAFLATAGSIGLLFGFSGALASTKKQDPTSFDQGLVGQVAEQGRQKRLLHESGARLASRALAYGTLYAVGGCAVLFYGLWKLSGADNLEDFRQKAGQILPRVPKNDPPQSRTEFSGLNDFLQYVIDKDKEEKKSNVDQNGGSKQQ